MRNEKKKEKKKKKRKKLTGRTSRCAIEATVSINFCKLEITLLREGKGNRSVNEMAGKVNYILQDRPLAALRVK